VTSATDPKPEKRSRGQGRTGRAPRVKVKISLSSEAYDGLYAKARARGMTIEGLIGEMLDLAEHEERKLS
jgi:hypothetical protein